MILHIDVVNNVATYRKRDGDIVCGNSDYQIQFAFDSEWDAHDTKTARFIWNGGYTDVEFTGDTCDVPVITNATQVTVGVYAGELATTTPAEIKCRLSILCFAAKPSEENERNYASEAQKAAVTANDKAAIADEAADNAEAAADRAEAAAERAEAAGGGSNGKDGKDGIGIKSIEKTNTEGLVDTYTITLTDDSTQTFTVTNGKDGEDGADGSATDLSNYVTTAQFEAALGAYITDIAIEVNALNATLGDGNLTEEEPSEPAPTLIAFTIDGISYQAEEGMTWEQWCGSTYDTGYNGEQWWAGTYVSAWGNNYVSTNGSFSGRVLATETITANYAYSIYMD